MISVFDEAQLVSAISLQESEINIENNILITSLINVGYTCKITCVAGSSLIWANPRAGARVMMGVLSSGDLTIDGLIVDAEGRDGTFFLVSGGKLTINNCTLKGIVSTSAQNVVQLGQYSPTQNGGELVLNNSLVTQIRGADTIIGYSARVSLFNSQIIDNFATGLSLLPSLNGDRPSLSMGGNSKISNNLSNNAPGGLVLFATDAVIGLSEGDESLICGNSSVNFAYGGVYLSEQANLTLRYKTRICDNFGANFAGGIGAGYNSTITMEHDSIVTNNRTDGNGGGVGLVNSTLIMKNNSLIEGNICENLGKGLHLSQSSVLRVVDNACILDGVYFNDDCIPIIDGALSATSSFVLEVSDYVDRQNVPVVVGIKSQACPLLGENERSAFVSPFEEGYEVVLDPTNCNVLITRSQYKIEYLNLEGATHTNPLSYDVSVLPIELTSAKGREDYAFKHWKNSEGEVVSTIEVGCTGDITLTAEWEKIRVKFEPNARYACNIPKPVESRGGFVVIPNIVPTRCCYRFLGWNMPHSGSGKVFFPLDKIFATQSITLYAQWIEE